MAKAGKGARTRTGNPRLSKTNQLSRDGVDPIFQDMLHMESPPVAHAEEEKRPLKRRRVAGRAGQSDKDTHKKEEPVIQQKHSSPSLSKTDEDEFVHLATPTEGPRQIFLNHSDTSDESDLEWEDVGQQNSWTAAERETTLPKNDNNTGADLSIVLNEKQDAKEQMSKQRRRLRTLLEKNRRIETHKVHILCLLAHTHLLNTWCNDRSIQAILKPLLPPRVVTKLSLDPDASQFQQSRLFLEGLSFAAELWKSRFKITVEGMKKPNWTDLEDQQRALPALAEHDEPISKNNFQKAASELKGSQDLASELFCCMLRSVGVDTRLVCSLQPLDFASRPLTASQKLQKAVVYAEDDTGRPDSIQARSSARSTAKQGTGISGRIRRFGGGNIFKQKSSSRAKPSNQQRTVSIMPYPIFWVEAFNFAHQKWVPVNPFGDPPVCKPSALEPPLSYGMNSMTYVIAFDKNGSAKDVTKRYAKAFNAKTRKYRVESLPSGDAWLARAMRVYRKRKCQDRDQVEDAELARREAAEGLPKNVQDFKNHPYYVLERHLRRNEVIHPRNEVGKVGVGGHASTSLEIIYRRRDVKVVRSADKWYRLGREVKEGEQPLKYLAVAKGNGKRQDDDFEEEQEDIEGRALYAFYQTELYVPPSVIRGKVPRNAYGNLDVYVPSMVPPGGSHIKHRDAARAARILSIDYADAITGFQFKGRRGTAITEGIVVAEEYREAVEAVIEGLVREHNEIEGAKRTKEVLRMWKRFMVGLKIVNHVKGYGSGEDEGAHGNFIADDNDDDYVHGNNEDMGDAKITGGGFLPTVGEQLLTSESSPKRYLISLQPTNLLDDGNFDEGGFAPVVDESSNKYDFLDVGEPGGGFITDDEPKTVPEPTATDNHRFSEFYVADGPLAGQFVNLRDENALEGKSSEFVVGGENEQEQFISTGQHDYLTHQPYHEENPAPAGIKSSSVEPGNKLEEHRRLKGDVGILPIPDKPAASITSYLPDDEVKLGLEPTAVAANSAYSKPNSPQSDDAQNDVYSDKGSLLSEDPEYEDAVPDWLASD